MRTKVKVLKKGLKFCYDIARTLRDSCKFIQIYVLNNAGSAFKYN